MDDVEIVRAFDGGGEIQHLVQLPRPHVRIVPVAVRVDRVQRCPGRRIRGGEKRHVVTSRDEPFGEERGHLFDRPGF